MRILPVLAFMLAGCSSTKPVESPSNSRAKEQSRLDAATAPKTTSRGEEILRPDVTKAFNPSAANFGSARSVSTNKARTNEFYFVDKTRTKNFDTHDFTTKEASSSKIDYATNAAPTKESWFSRLTARTKSYPTRESSDAGKNVETRPLPGGDQTFAPKGRKQASLDKNGAAVHPPGGDRVGGESWSGDLKPLTVQDVRTLLNKN